MTDINQPTLSTFDRAMNVLFLLGFWVFLIVFVATQGIGFLIAAGLALTVFIIDSLLNIMNLGHDNQKRLDILLKRQ